MSLKLASIQVPDLRFEQSFLRSLQAYAGSGGSDTTLSEKELMQVDSTDTPPLNPITPSIVLYAVLKDQLLMPFVQGFLWAAILMLWRPMRVALIGAGQSTGKYLFNMIGVGRV
jgi:hypothetical protein